MPVEDKTAIILRATSQIHSEIMGDDAFMGYGGHLEDAFFIARGLKALYEDGFSVSDLVEVWYVQTLREVAEGL